MSLIGRSPASPAATRPLASDLGALLDTLSSAIHDDASEPIAASPTRTTTGQRLFGFGVAGGSYAVPLEHVVEMQRLPAVTRLPNVPDWVRGVVNLRGDIVSVVDPATFLNLTHDVRVDHSRKLLVLKSLASDLQIGLMVDHVFGLRTVSGTAIQPTTGTIHDTVTPYLTGVCEIGAKLFVVLNGERLLNALSEAFVKA